MRIVFMGTPDFAVPCLKRLIDDGNDVIGVFSQPDRPKGRGYTLSPTPVKALALEHGIPVFQPEKVRDGAALAELQRLDPELIVVVAYGRILPIEILELPKFGCVNVHASLLPKLRGAAPIQWSIINGDAETGVTTMFMAEGLDTGDTIMTLKTAIAEDETAGELFERLSALGAEVLSNTIAALQNGTTTRTPQDDAQSTYAPMLDKKIARIDFDKTADEICNLVRGLNPSPMAFTKFDDKIVKILAAKPNLEYNGVSGEILDEKTMVVGCKNGAIRLIKVKPEGKGAMSAEEFARGKRIAKGQKFE